MNKNKLVISVFAIGLLWIPVSQGAEEGDHAAHHPATEQGEVDGSQDGMSTAMPMQEMQNRMQEMQVLM